MVAAEERVARGPRRVSWTMIALGWSLITAAVAATGAWAWSGYKTIDLTDAKKNVRYTAFIGRGTVYYDEDAGFRRVFEVFIEPANATGLRWDLWRFDVFRARSGRHAGVSLWPAVAAAAAGGVWLVRAGIRRRRWSQSMCAACGYSLAGINADRCPECGRELAAQSGTKAAPTQAQR